MTTNTDTLKCLRGSLPHTQFRPLEESELYQIYDIIHPNLPDVITKLFKDCHQFNKDAKITIHQSMHFNLAKG